MPECFTLLLLINHASPPCALSVSVCITCEANHTHTLLLPTAPVCVTLHWTTHQPHCCTHYQVFVFGGMGADGELLNDLWVYDQDSLTWTSVTIIGGHPPPSPRRGERVRPSSFFCAFEKVSWFEVSLATISTQQERQALTIAAFFFHAGATLSVTEDGRRLYLFGGNDGSRALNDVHFMEIERLSWGCLQVHVSGGCHVQTHTCVSVLRLVHLCEWHSHTSGHKYTHLHAQNAHIERCFHLLPFFSTGGNATRAS